MITQKLQGKRGLLESQIIFSSPTTAQKRKFFIKNFFSKCDQIRCFLRIWLHLLKKSLMENFIFCEVHFFASFSFFDSYPKCVLRLTILFFTSFSKKKSIILLQLQWYLVKTWTCIRCSYDVLCVM